RVGFAMTVSIWPLAETSRLPFAVVTSSTRPGSMRPLLLGPSTVCPGRRSRLPISVGESIFHWPVGHHFGGLSILSHHRVDSASHITVDLAGQARFGPDVEWISKVDYTVDPGRGDAFYAAIRTYWPDLRDGALQPGYAGVRPKISGPGEPAAD